MLNLNCSTAKKGGKVVPGVLLVAKKKASRQMLERRRSQAIAWNDGPWDKGHWANRQG